MNIYACWYQGRPGYCFEHRRSGWWFIPEQGQSDTEVRRHLSLADFVFANRFDWQLEQSHAAAPRWQRCLRALVPPLKPRSVAGLLLLPTRSM